MPNDAKVGLVVGLGLVIGVAVMFYRKDPMNPGAAGAFPSPLRATVPSTAPRGVYRPARSPAVTRIDIGNLEKNQVREETSLRQP